ncbi:hypothetical protein BaRGS_00024383 [Batillaria attramentaria]|uniref:Uncharacterized protein n=1 Tax=Batillaria attramentaria TaxID=370345 RepID=A0ABD0KBA7_9CAEN
MASKRSHDDAHSSTSKSATKKLKVTQKFTDKYLKIPGISRSSLGDSYAHCDYCKCDFSITHSGSFDIQGHLKTKKHTNYLSLARDTKAVNQPKLNMFMPTSSGTLSAMDRDIVRTEVMVTESVVKITVLHHQLMFSRKLSRLHSRTQKMLKGIAIAETKPQRSSIQCTEVCWL